MNRRRLALLAVAAVLALLFGGRWIALRYTDALWFESLGQAPRYRALLVRAVLWQSATFFIAFAWYTGHTLGVYASIGAVHLPRRLGNLEIDEAVPQRILRGIAIAMAALLAFATAYTFNDLHELIALARGAAPWGAQDPVLHQDVAFYLAVLPLIEVLHLLASVLAVLATLLVVTLYAITGSLAISRRRLRITPHARTHLLILLAVLALVIAWGFQLDAYQMVAGGGHAGGALNPTDRAIRIPASNLLAIFALVVAGGTVLALRWVRPLLLTSFWALLAVLTLLGRVLIPVMTEAWGASADPALVAQVSQETDEFSRRAFGLADIQSRSLPAGDVRPESTAAFTQALESVDAWSGSSNLLELLLDDAIGDTSGLREWSFTPTEARDPSGHPAPATLAIWQTNIALAQRAIPRPNWTRLHRDDYAWGGEPIALEATPRAGGLTWLARLDPADTVPRLTPVPLTSPRIRFLPFQTDLGIVGPADGAPGESTPGVPLKSLVRRILMGWALQSPPLLDEHTNYTDRAIYWRDIPTRLALLYPFAGFDPPRAAIVDGRLIWIIDGYLSSSRFPLATPIRWRGEDVNYIAAVYLVTVDAASGETRFYLRPLASAFAASVARSSSLSPLPADSIPLGVRLALRYPDGLLGGQAQALAAIGERDPHGSGGWSLAWPDTAAATHDPGIIHATVAVMALERELPRSWSFLPLIDKQGSQLTALVAGALAPSGELDLQLLRVPVPGIPTPRDAASRMSAAPAVLAATAFMGGTDNGLKRGPVLVVPAAGTTAFAQLLYTTGHAGDPVRLQGIAILAGTRAGFGTDVRSATRSMMRGDSSGLGAAFAGAGIADARAAFMAMDSARLSGDWQRFGQEWAHLRRALHLETAAAPSGGPRP
ncbi:MAG TPA: UPF0182 family protein [Gemmatimonadales bacterium]|jgi:hypothetical protein